MAIRSRVCWHRCSILASSWTCCVVDQRSAGFLTLNPRPTNLVYAGSRVYSQPRIFRYWQSEEPIYGQTRSLRRDPASPDTRHQPTLNFPRKQNIHRVMGMGPLQGKEVPRISLSYRHLLPGRRRSRRRTFARSLRRSIIIDQNLGHLGTRELLGRGNAFGQHLPHLGTR